MEYENYSPSENTLLSLLIQINKEEEEAASAQNGSSQLRIACEATKHEGQVCSAAKQKDPTKLPGSHTPPADLHATGMQTAEPYSHWNHLEKMIGQVSISPAVGKIGAGVDGKDERSRKRNGKDRRIGSGGMSVPAGSKIVTVALGVES